MRKNNSSKGFVVARFVDANNNDLYRAFEITDEDLAMAELYVVRRYRDPIIGEMCDGVTVIGRSQDDAFNVGIKLIRLFNMEGDSFIETPSHHLSLVKNRED
jgi:hypothetical protein